jgi:mannose-6-phosphate isomerase-like protein (cupin superfamily)
MNKEPFADAIEKHTLENEDFRRVLYTAKHSQIVLMSLSPGEDIGEEVHHVDQFLRFEAGEGMSIIDGKEYHVSDGSAVLVPAGARHNIVNTGHESLKLYTLYAPPNHIDGRVHHTKADAEADVEDEEFGERIAQK